MQLPGHHVAIIDSEGNELPVGIEGDLAVRGRPPTLFAGYWEAPDETKAAFRGDWYLTGDVAMADEDGFIWFVGRAEDVISSRGRNFGPYEVERILRGHDAIAASAVIGLRDLQRGGQFVRAYVVPRPGFEGSEQLQAELRQFVGQALPEQQVPREIAFVDELPTVGGKVNRHALRERPVVGRPLWDLPPTSDLELETPPTPTAPEPTSAPPTVAEAAPLVQPQPIVAPEPETVVPATPEPVAEAAPTHAPEWEVVVEPAPIRAPEPAPEREPEHVETTSTREPQWEPIDDGAPLRAPEPDPVVTPVPAPTPEPVAEAAPALEPTPEPDPVRVSEPEPVALPEPEPMIVLEPEPVAEAVLPEPEPPALVPEPVAGAVPVAEPIVAVELEPIPSDVQPLSEPAHMPEFSVVPEPEPLPDFIVQPGSTPERPPPPPAPEPEPEPDLGPLPDYIVDPTKPPAPNPSAGTQGGCADTEAVLRGRSRACFRQTSPRPPQA